MAIGHRNSSSAAGASGTATSITVNEPTGAASGDLLFAVIVSSGGTGQTINTAPSGWTALTRVDATTLVSIFPYWIIRGAGAANYSWTLNSGQRLAGGISAYTGVDTTTPIGDTNPNTNSTAGATFTANAVTSTITDSWIVAVFGWNRTSATSVTITQPTSYLERYDQNFVGTSFATGVEASDILLSGTGSSGSLSATASANSTYAALTLVLNPAATMTEYVGMVPI